MYLWTAKYWLHRKYLLILLWIRSDCVLNAQILALTRHYLPYITGIILLHSLVMVKVKSSLFNYISGKSGNAVFRQMNGKTFYSIRPDSYNISQSVKAKESRNNFALAVKFTKEVNKHPALKLVWKRAKLKGTTSYHRIIKHNIKFIKEISYLSSILLHLKENISHSSLMLFQTIRSFLS